MIGDFRLAVDARIRAAGFWRRWPRCVGHAMVAVLFVAATMQGGSASGQNAQSSLQGKLDNAGGALKVASSGGSVNVTSENAALLHTLQDSRLNGREVKLEGERKPDGSFDASHLFTLRDGKLFRVRFYCHVCNIPAIQPGNCVCCQRPTELEEIPTDEVTDDMVMVP